MDHVDEISLHYAMLEYLYDNHKLASSCFSYVWDDFIRENANCANLTTTQLKTIFWTEIATNIEDYELLTDKQKEYFDPETLMVNNTCIGELQSVLENNEPRAGVDFSFWRSTTAYESSHDVTIQPMQPEEMAETVQEVFEKPVICKSTFCEDSVDTSNEDINEDSRINVIAQKPEFEIDTGERLIETFKKLMLTKDDIEAGKTMLTDEDVFNRLADPEFEIELPPGLKHFIQKFGSTILDEDVEETPQTFAEPSAVVKRRKLPGSPRLVSSTPLLTFTGRTTRFSSEISKIEKSRRLSLLSQQQQQRQNVSPKGMKMRSQKIQTSKSDSNLHSTKFATDQQK